MSIFRFIYVDQSFGIENCLTVKETATLGAIAGTVGADRCVFSIADLFDALPILVRKKDTLSRYVNKLEKKGLISRLKVSGSTSLHRYSITEKCDTLDVLRQSLSGSDPQSYSVDELEWFLYVATQDNGRYKVGVSNNVGRRMNEIAHMSGFDTRCVHYFECNNRPHAYELESRAHRCLINLKVLGEWFADDNDSEFLRKVSESTGLSL